MATVKMTTPFSTAVIVVDESRVEELAALGWTKATRARKSEKDSSED